MPCGVERLGLSTVSRMANPSIIGAMSSPNLGWHRSTIAKIEAGERRLAEFISIAEALKVEPAVLFGRVLRW
ncbi:MAG: hypothetical protein JWO52_5900 [Gammaproteobacteria bacterium]|nr:hypothetical protein [Gammaproteobacteria bacterium]